MNCLTESLVPIKNLVNGNCTVDVDDELEAHRDEVTGPRFHISPCWLCAVPTHPHKVSWNWELLFRTKCFFIWSGTGWETKLKCNSLALIRTLSVFNLPGMAQRSPAQVKYIDHPPASLWLLLMTLFSFYFVLKYWKYVHECSLVSDSLWAHGL